MLVKQQCCHQNKRALTKKLKLNSLDAWSARWLIISPESGIKEKELPAL
jgi:hypothetical protein